MSIRDGQPEPSWPTGMSASRGENWPVRQDLGPDGLPREPAPGQAVATLCRVGWLDQKGRVWLATPPGAQFDGGSLTPLLIDTREQP